MKPLVALVSMRLDSLRNHFCRLKRDSAAKMVVVVMGLLNVLAIGLWVSYKSFEFLDSFRSFGPDLNAKMVSLLFFAVLVLVILSTMIITYTTLFLAKETGFFFQHPVPPRTILFVKLGEAVSFSSWASLFLCLPVLVSFGLLRDAPLLYYLEATLVLMIFLVFAGLVGVVATIIVAPLVKRLSPRRLLVGGALLLCVLGWTFLRSFNLLDMDGENNLLILDRFTTNFAALHSSYSPSRWASAAVLAAVVGNHGEVGFQFGLLLANTLIFVPLLSLYGSRSYGRHWLDRQSVFAGSLKPKTRNQGKRGLCRGPLGGLMLKDLLVFLRDPAQLSQSLLFVLLMVIYSLSLLQIPQSIITGKLQRFIYFANLGAICMILSSFTSRFLFPLLSLEGRAFWILGLAPMPRTHLLRQKMLFGLAVTLSLGLLVVVVSNANLRSSPFLFASAVYTMVLAATCLTSLATGLGAAYPNFDEDNPARIAVGLGGTLNFFASALAVAFVIFLQALPYLVWGRTSLPPTGYLLASHCAALAFTVFVSFTALSLGGRALARCEF